MPDLPSADVKTADPNVEVKTGDVASPPKLCVDCANYFEEDMPVLGLPWHFCRSDKLVDLVTGKKDPVLSCETQRAGSGPRFCGPDASFFTAQDASP